MNTKQIVAVMAFLGVDAFTEAEGKKVLTEDQMSKLVEEYGEDYAAKVKTAVTGETPAQAKSDSPPPTTDTTTVAELKSKLATMEEKVGATKTEKEDLMKQVKQLQNQIKILSLEPDKVGQDKPTPETDESGSDVTMSTSHLFGVEESFMAIDKAHPYNKRAYAALMSLRGEEVSSPKATKMDYESLKSDLGDYYRVRKQDKIQSFLVELPTIEKLFPLESGYQDQAVLVNMFLLGDFSQSNNTASTFSNVVKGGYKFEPEKITMFDVMFAHMFDNLKDIEKTWIGYLNKEGSDTMKMSFVEFILVETAKKLHNEQEMRRINGIHVDAVKDVAGTAMTAADGLREFLRKQISQFKIRPFALGEWSESTIADYVRRGTQMVPAPLRDSGNIVLYMPTDAYTAYIRNLEALYGLNNDYKANGGFVKEYPTVKIEVIPNMAESKRLIWTLKGNIILLEDQPGEMLDFMLEQEDWKLKVWSNWKESVWAYFVGKQHASLDAIPTDFSTQMIFCNDVDFPADWHLVMDDSDTTPSVKLHGSLISQENTNPTVITNIDDAVVGQIVRIKVGNGTNAPTIAASGNFSLLASAWEPEVGDEIYLMKRSDGKFIELARIIEASNYQAFAANDATPSVADGTVFITNSNTAATAITSLDDAEYKVTYTIHGAGSANASTIANSGNFVLTAAMTLTAGTWIKVAKSIVNDKFYESDRSA